MRGLEERMLRCREAQSLPVDPRSSFAERDVLGLVEGLEAQAPVLLLGDEVLVEVLDIWSLSVAVQMVP